MTHNDLLLLLLGSFLPNNLISWFFRKLFRRPRTSSEKSTFAHMAIAVGDMFGSPPNFIMWIVLVGIWIWSGHLFHYNNTWQLLINTPTTVIELFAAILIQYVGNRIERRQEENEQRMLTMLATTESMTEMLVAMSEDKNSSVDKPATPVEEWTVPL